MGARVRGGDNPEGSVMPTKAELQRPGDILSGQVIPAKAGSRNLKYLGPRVRGGDHEENVIPVLVEDTRPHPFGRPWPGIGRAGDADPGSLLRRRRRDSALPRERIIG